MHHALADGFSMKKLINKVKTMVKIPYDVSTYLEVLFRTKILRSGRQVTRSEYVSVIDKQSLGMTLCTKSINLAVVKKIAAGHSVSASAVLISAVQGSIQKCGGAKGLLYFPLPTDFHPEKLRNVSAMGYTELLQDGNRREKLERTEEQLRNFKSSTFPGEKIVHGIRKTCQASILIILTSDIFSYVNMSLNQLRFCMYLLDCKYV
ncbi:hypothetical protein Fcan01_20924 [Folsomia candida]|uniref:Uncharacterized protein n=1 Tax=Folsomia candida TaxID=158441 RepID=A0A226DGJ5_FOLCA|nr:hypothetical protein Fcan01_20924 [Folsomia candida]